jgi:glycosyltransferase involved in cell wall biosynthesis
MKLVSPRPRTTRCETGDADISVIIPSVDRTELALETVRSVLVQTRPVREIIVVTNGSKEHAAFWQAHAGGKVRTVRQPSPGQQAARNAGIEAAVSTWVAMLDDDDLYSPEFIESVMPAIADGRADVIATDHRKFRVDRVDRKTNFEAAPAGYWKGIRPPTANAEWTFVGKFPLHLLLKRVPIYPSTTVMRRDFALGIGGYDPEMKGIRAEDLEFLVRALTYGTVSLVWRPLVSYRVHGGNLSNNPMLRAIGRWRVFEFARDNHPHLPASFCRALDRDLARRRRKIFKLAYDLGDIKLMEEAWSRLDPHQRTPAVLLMKLISRLSRYNSGQLVAQAP